MNDWKPFVTALLGSWPSQVGAWGKEAIAAYVSELEARGLTADAALVAVRSCPADQKFEPSAPELAGLARQDPSRPTAEECLTQLYGPGGVFGFKRSGVTISPWVQAFVTTVGRSWLAEAPVDDPDEGKWARKAIVEAWGRFLEASEGREVAEVARGRRGELGKPDLVGAVGAPRAQIGDGRS
jgi:hypothetical protein